MMRLIRPVLVLALLLVSTTATASDLTGSWRTVKSGTIFHVSPPIPAAVASALGKPQLSGAMIALRQPARGKLGLYVMRWVKGMRGAQFKFGAKALATMSPNGREARFTSGTIWQRVRAGGAGHAPAGWWRSSSGSLFMVTPPSHKGFFVANIKTIGPRSFVARAKWVAGMAGRQLRYGKSTATLAPGGRQMRVSGRRITTWTLLSPWGKARRAVRRPVAAVSITGRWRNPRSGAIIMIPKGIGRTFDVVWRSPNGRTARKLHAQWTKGLRGTQLQFFRRRRERVTCTWSPRSPSRMQVMGWDSRPQTWVRAR
ncbi:MAG: hypothetical protein KC502_15410 [Myxococcales bacterium]|nr:hypothetical protein [Myxococcales bacterium]